MVSLNAIREVKVVGSSQGLDKLEKDLRAVSSAMDGTSKAADENTRVTDRAARGRRELAGSYDGLRQKLDFAYRAEKQMAWGLAVIEREFERGRIGADELSRSMDMLASKFDAATIASQEMATRAARLRADLDPVAAAQSRLNAELAEYSTMAKAGAISADELARAQNMARGRFAETEKSLKGVADGTANAANQAKNLKFQLFDVGQSLAGGMPAWMVLMQQGPQIAQIYGAEEGGIGRAFKETAKMAGSLAASFWPVALAAGAVVAAIAGMQYEINAVSKVDVSFMDVATASIEVFTDAIYTKLKPAADAISPMFATAWDGVVVGVKYAGNYLINNWRTAYEMVTFIWKQFPTAIGAAMVGAANAAISATVDLVNKASDVMKRWADSVNQWLPEAMQIKGWPGLDPKAFQIKNPYADQLKEAVKDQRKTLEDIAKSDPLGEIFDDVKVKSIENANERIKETEKATKGAASAADDAARAFEQFSSRANGLVERYFPGEAARQEAQELQTLLGQYGNKLDALQRQAVELRIADQFKAASLGVRELANETRSAGNEMEQSLGDTLGNALSGLFTKPLKDLDAFVEEVMGCFAEVTAKDIALLFADETE